MELNDEPDRVCHERLMADALVLQLHEVLSGCDEPGGVRAAKNFAKLKAEGLVDLWAIGPDPWRFDPE